MKKTLVVILAVVMTVAAVLLAACKGAVYDFSVASDNFEQVEQSATDQQVHASFVSTTGGTQVTEPEDLHGYDHEAVKLQEGDVVEYKVSLATADKLAIYADWYIIHNGLSDSEVMIEINDNVVSARSSLKALWRNEREDFATDSFGNEIVPQQQKIDSWVKVSPLYEFDALTAIAPVYPFEQGDNVLRFTVMASGEFLLGDIVVRAEKLPDTYEQYAGGHSNAEGSGNCTIEAEHVYSKNSTSVVPSYAADVNVSPYETFTSPLNTMTGLASPNQTLTYEVKVEQDGLYNIAFNYNNENANRVTFARIDIDGKTPFRELLRYPFVNGDKYEYETLSDRKTGEPFGIYLTKGTHYLSVKIDGSMTASHLDELGKTITDLNGIYLDLKKIAGTIQDKNREWVPDRDYPGVVDRLNEISEQLTDLGAVLKQINGDENINYQAIISIEAAKNAIDGLLEKPQYIANNYAQLSEGSGSIVQTLANARTDVENTPLNLDKIVVFPKDGDMGVTTHGGFYGFWEGVRKFFKSFVTDYSITSSDEDTIEAWVARGRQYVDLMQQLIDASDFTARTGYKVRFSILADEGKLILSNAANIAPNAVMGISNWLPYEMGIRDLTVDLTQFADYGEVISRFSSGALISLIADGRGLALPETQDFYVMYYRKDVLRSLGIYNGDPSDLPQTWEDVKRILPELQRAGLNFYIPLSSSTSSKSIMTTAPFIYQYGGNLFSDDAMSTTIAEENSLNAIKLMTELYTLYGLPQQISNFFDNFRTGSLPIGVSTFDTYLRLSMAAPEIAGQWGIALSPGVMNDNGEIERWQTGSATAMTLMKCGNDQKDAAGWELLKWWSSAEIQTEFMNRLTMLYGKAYIWNSANLEAFNNSVAFTSADKKIIAEQWQWMREIPKVPGWYMLERELSNAWNNIVINGQNTRSAVEDAVTKIDKELVRKLEEFGYVQDGKLVKQYKITTLQDIEALKRQGN